MREVQRRMLILTRFPRFTSSLLGGINDAKLSDESFDGNANVFRVFTHKISTLLFFFIFLLRLHDACASLFDTTKNFKVPDGVAFVVLGFAIVGLISFLSGPFSSIGTAVSISFEVSRTTRHRTTYVQNRGQAGPTTI